MIPTIYFVIVALIFIFVLFPLIIFLMFRKSILSFFFPEDWVIIEFLERDNNVKTWLQKKEKNLQFTFNNGIYNMFEVVDTSKEDIGRELSTMPPLNPELRVFTSIYRQGRLAKLYFKEGNKDPMDYRTGQIKGDSQQAMQIEKAQLSDILNAGGGLGEEFLRKYGVIIFIGLIILVLFLALK